jgi:hypothetical protein
MQEQQGSNATRAVLTALVEVYDRLDQSSRYRLITEDLSERTADRLLDLVERRERQQQQPPRAA